MHSTILALALLVLAACSATRNSFIVPRGTNDSDWSADERECLNIAQSSGVVPGIVAGTAYEVPTIDNDAYVRCMEKKGYKYDGWGWTRFKT